MGKDNTKDIEPIKLEDNGLERNPDGTVKSGVLNPNGRPKRKTLTELIHAKLDNTPQAWEAIVALVVQKILKDGDKDILKTFWEYTDGKPIQKNQLGGLTDEDGKLIPINIIGGGYIPRSEQVNGTSEGGNMGQDKVQDIDMAQTSPQDNNSDNGDSKTGNDV